MFHFLEYPFSRGSTHIVSPDPYEAPDFDAGFMNDERDMAPMVRDFAKYIIGAFKDTKTIHRYGHISRAERQLVE